MAFNSLAYALLLTFTVAWMAIGPLRALMLIVASLIFYAAAGPFDMLVFLAAVTLNWLIQVVVPADRRRIVAAVIVNIGLIGYFKYRNMLLGETSPPGSYINLALPLGISFYSFQALAYHIDVVRGRNGPARSFREFFLFKAFFPQLIAGPIVRPNQTLPQIQRIFDDRWRRHRLLVFGLSLVVLGLVKKVVLADSLAPVVDDIFYVRPDSAYLAWLGAVLFTFQIYFDFSGYSDIAIGSAYLLGIRLPQNFATPFLAASIQQLWQRWHITLTMFLRDRPNHGVLWPVARGRLEFRVVGRVAGCCDGVCGTVVEIPSVTAGSGGMGRHDHVFRHDVGLLPLAESGICIQLSRHHAIIPRWLAGGGRRRRATLGGSGRCGGIIRAALDRVPFATAWRSSRHAPSRGAGQPRIPVGRRAATDPDPGDQCEPIHLFSVLDSPPCLSPHCPRGSLV